MKLLYEIGSGHVVARYSDAPTGLMGLLFTPTASPGHALVTVPESIAVPEAIIRVVEGDELEYVVDSSAVDHQWAIMKQLRRQKLAESDWICSVTDYVIPQREAWIAYRQALRDLTKQANPFALVWPVDPSDAVTAPSELVVEPVAEPVAEPASESVAEPVEQSA